MERKSFYRSVLFLILVCLSVLAIIKTVFVSLDIDEGYAIAQACRLAKGERLFLDLWEPHQLSAVFFAPFLRAFLLFSGKTTGIVIFSRIIGTMIHLLIGIFLFITLYRKISPAKNMFLFFLHVNFLPKWVQSPEFELQQYWFALLCFLFLYLYFGDGKKRVFLFIAGICYLSELFSYPSLILLFPLFLFGIYVCEKEKKGKSLLMFTLGALLPGLAFLYYVFYFISFGDFIQNLGFLFLDESHTLVSMGTKWKLFFSDGLAIFLRMAVVGGAAFLISCLFKKDKKRLFVVSVFLILSVWQILGLLFWNENQFYLSWRFLAFALCGFLFPGKEEKHFLILPSILSVLCVLMMSNMDVNTAITKVFPGVLGTLILLPEEGLWEGRVSKFVPVLTFGSLLSGLIFCKLIMIRVTGCLPVTIRAPLCQMEQGPEKGLFLPEKLYTVLTQDYGEMQNEIMSEDRLLYVGGENLIYLWTAAEISTPSTQGTNAYNEIFTSYYEKYPEKIPTVIVWDKELEENPYYYNSPNNTVLLGWMDEKGYEIRKDGHYLLYYRKK